MRYASKTGWAALALCLYLPAPACVAQETGQEELDARVQQFLESHRHAWRDANVPVEIGTSTGHSAIWIAWALSKTGGKLITIEIHEGRYREALENFEEAGLSEFIDARLADAHELVPELEGPFDFVFVDADKDWYTNYLRAVLPKLEVGGCFTAHNVSGGRMRGISGFLEELESTPNLETEIVRASRSGLSVSYKRSP